MSRGLGETQRRALGVVAGATAGISTRALGSILSVTPRRLRTIVASLVGRGLLVVTPDAIVGRRVWLPEQHAAFVADQRRRDADREWLAALLAIGRGTCPTCGAPVEVDGGGSIRTGWAPVSRLRPVERRPRPVHHGNSPDAA